LNLKNFLLPAFCAAVFLSGCASGEKQSLKAVNPAVQNIAKKPKHPDTESVGPDVIVGLSAEEVWPFLSKVEDWGSWCSKVTQVQPGAGLSPGAEIKWQWEEKAVDSFIVTVQENKDFSFKSCASSAKAIVHWRLNQRADGSTLISLRAEVPYGTASETMEKLGGELNDWITALQAAANKE
jgi:hypothetical protein